MYALRYHGNYVGPGWSAGRYQPSVASSSVPAIDQFDLTGKEHDRAYALQGNLKEADYKFYRQNIGRGWKRSAAAMAVGIQGFLRKPNSFLEKKKPKLMPPAFRTPRSMSRTPRFTPTPVRRLTFESQTNLQRAARQAQQYRVRTGGRLLYTGQQRFGAPYFIMKRQRPRARYVRKSTSGQPFTGKIKKGTKKATVRQKIEKAGVTFIYELGGLVDSPTQSALGHATFAPTRVIELIFAAIVKKALLKLGHQFQHWDEEIGANFTVGDQFIIYGRADEIGLNLQMVTYNIASTVVTWANVVDAFRLQYLAFLEAQGNPHSPMIVQLVYFPANNATVPAVHKYGRMQMNLQDAKIQLYMKSDMKIQNRTVTVATDNDADDVNNVPVVGKVFDGSGTGALLNIVPLTNAADFRLTGNINMGLIYNGGGNYTTGGEPLQKKNFKYVSHEGSLKLGPGEIKTSTLLHSKSHKIDVILKNLFDTTAPGVLNFAQRIGFGKFRFFQFDRLIDVGSTQSNLTIAYEINLYCNANLKLGRATQTLPKYARVQAV